MGVMVRFGRKKAFLRRGSWISADPSLETLLTDTTEAWIQETGGPPIRDKDHEYTVARVIADRLGGRIARRTPGSSPKVAAIYISRRQLKLDF